MNDEPNQLDLDPSLALERIDSWIDGMVEIAPNVLVAIVVFFVFLGIGALIKRFVRSRAAGRGRDNLGEMLGGMARWVVIIFGTLIAATIVVPSLKPGDLISGLGISSVAIGFAFKDILQNWLAGMLILIRQPFEVGDQIEVAGYEGTVQRIETRATMVRTYDGQRAVIPNSEIYTSALLVKTGNQNRRSQYDIGIGYGDGIDEACGIILDVLKSIPGIESDPEPQAFPWELAASWVTIRARWWTDSRSGDIVGCRAQVIQKVKEALDEAKIDMPYETHVQLIHDQTEATDGDRGAQREGWAGPREGQTQPRWKAQLEAQSGRDNT